MGWAEIKKAINSDLATPLNTLISSKFATLTSAMLQKTTWTDARAAKLDNLNQSLSATQASIISAFSAGSVKSVQYGTGSIPNGDGATVVISHSSVNLIKSYVILNGSGSLKDFNNTYGFITMLPMIKSRATTSMTIGKRAFNHSDSTVEAPVEFSWQVIEFY